MTLSPRNVLLAVVFFTGAAVLVVEVTATRILAPYFGNTIYTFSSVLGVVLGALSCGYAAGGKLADRHPSLRVFYAIVAASGASVLVLQLLALTLLPALGFRLPIASGPLVLSLLLFFPPGFLLGMLSPFAVRLAGDFARPGEGIGSIAGRVFFFSTVGSIAGSLLAGFVLIPHFGVSQIVLATGGLLIGLGSWGMGRSRRHQAAVLAPGVLLAAGVAALLPLEHPAGALVCRDGLYEKITICDTVDAGRPARVLLQDRAASAVLYLDNGEELDYLKYYAVAELFRRPMRRALVLGGGSYILPKLLVERYEEAEVDVVEIEPALFELAQRHFGVKPSPRLHNSINDGRRFLADTKARYDLIFCDVYYGMSVPPHFATREFFELVRSRLETNGVFVANFVGDLRAEPPAIVPTLWKTLGEVFPNNHAFAVESPESVETQSIVAVAVNGGAKIDFASLGESAVATLRALGEHRIDPARFDWTRYPTLTDNYAPVEYLATRALRRELDPG